MYSFLLWLTITLFLLWCLTHITAQYRDRRFFKLLFLPCVLLEGGIKLLACALSGVAVKEVRLVEPNKPFVTTAKSRVPLVGLPLWVIVWLGVFYATFHVAVTQTTALNAHTTALPELDPAAISQGFVKVDGRSYLHGLRVLWSSTIWSAWELWLIGYFLVGSFPLFAVSWKHVRAGLAVIGVAGLLAACTMYAGIGPSLFSRGWYFSQRVLPSHFRVFSLFVTVLALTVLLHLGAQLLWRAVQISVANFGSGATRRSRQKRASQPA